MIGMTTLQGFDRQLNINLPEIFHKQEEVKELL